MKTRINLNNPDEKIFESFILKLARQYRFFIPFLIPVVISFALNYFPNFFDPNAFWNFEDGGFPLDPQRDLLINSSTWNPFNNGWGSPNYLRVLTPWYSIIAGTQEIGIPSALMNRLFFLLPQMVVGWSTFFLYRSLFNTKNSWYGAVISIPFTILIPVFILHPINFLSIGGFFIIFGLFIRAIYGRLDWIVASCLIGLSTLLVTIHPQAAVVLLYTIIITVFFILFDRDVDKFRILKIISFSLTLAFVINAYWLIPFLQVYSAIDIVGEVESKTFDFAVYGILERWGLNWSNLFWVMQFTGGGSNIPEAYQSDFRSVITLFFLPLAAFSTLYLSKEKIRFLIIGLSMIFLFLSTTLYYESFRPIYLFLFENIPGVNIIYLPYHWLIPVFGFFAVMIGRFGESGSFLLSKWLHLAKTKKNITVSVVMILIILLAVDRGNTMEIQKSYATNTPLPVIPEDYKNLVNFLNENATIEERILNLPTGLWSKYTWWNEELKIAEMAEVLNYISPIPVVGAEQYQPGLKTNLINIIDAGRIEQAAKAMQTMGISYVLIHKDYTTRNHGLYDEAFMTNEQLKYLSIFSNSKFFRKILDTDNFILYELNLPKYKNQILIEKLSTSKKSFDSNSYVVIPNSESYHSLDFSAIASFKTEVNQTQIIVGKWWSGATNYASFVIFMNNEGDLISAIQTELIPTEIKANRNVADGLWHMAVLTYDGKFMKLYVDGELANEIEINKSLDSTTAPITIGAANSGTDKIYELNPDENIVKHFFNGDIADVKIYSDVLDEEEISELYQAETKGEYKIISERNLTYEIPLIDFNTDRPSTANLLQDFNVIGNKVIPDISEKNVIFISPRT